MTGMIAIKYGKPEVLDHVREHPVVILVFSMDGCGPCRVIKDKIKTFSGKYEDVTFLDCNVNASAENDSFAESELIPDGYPTVYVYINGKLMDQDADFKNIESVVINATSQYQGSLTTPQKTGRGSSTGRTGHAFVGYKGGSGKSTILFQTACQYAKNNPQDNVLVVDCSFSGDLSHMFLRKHGRLSADKTTRFIIKSLYDDKISSRHLFEFLLRHQSDETPKDDGQRRLFYDSFYSPMEALHIGGARERSTPDIAKMFSVKVSDYNAHIPMDNLYLIPSGHDDRQPAAGMGEKNVPKLAKLLRMCLDDLQGKNWKIFFDTDGDFQLTSSLQVILRACDTMVTITEVDNMGFKRIITLLEDIKEYQDDILARPSREDISEFPDIQERTKIAGLSAILFNKVERSPQQGKRFDELGCDVLPHMVATRNLIKDNAGRFTYAALTMGTKFGSSGLFKNLQDLPPGISYDERAAFFMQRMFAVIQTFKVPLSLSIDAGIPVCCMELNKTYTSDISYGSMQVSSLEYNITNERFLNSLIDNIDEVIARL